LAATTAATGTATATGTGTGTGSGAEPWQEWGPYLSERAWGTVREDYSEQGDAWKFFPHDHARSRAYRWNEDGLAGVCDGDQTWCLALALWNGVDPILKERIFGLTGPEGNHGEDAKEYWWYLDSTPTHSWMRWRYHYPQREFPYERLVAENGRRSRSDPEFELVDTGVFDDDRYWVVTVDYAKAGPHDLCMRITVDNRGPEAATLHVLPTLWFRNTWSWGEPGPGEAGPRPQMRVADADADADSQPKLVATHDQSGTLTLVGGGNPEAVTCDNESNTERLWGVANATPYPKDGINDHVVRGADTVNPGGVGTKGALWYALTVAAGASAEVRVRLTTGTTLDLGGDFDETMRLRRNEADGFYADLTPQGASDDEARVLRQAFAGLLWSKQHYRYDVTQWLDGDAGSPKPPASRLAGRNASWRHLAARHIISMPDKWEYPWFAAWDLAFQAVALAHVDPQFAKAQLVLMCREGYMHPNGQLAAYEWDFGDVNPPVHATAALAVFEIDGGRDLDFLRQIFHKLVANFTWWVNREDADGNNLFEGGFLGLDNIGLFDRSRPLPPGMSLEQSDSTAWMVLYSLDMFRMALRLAVADPVYQDMARKFARHAFAITMAARDQGLWDEDDGFFYDLVRGDDGTRVPLRTRSMVGLVPLMAVAVVDEHVLAQLKELARTWAEANRPHLVQRIEGIRTRHLLSMVDRDRAMRIFGRLLDEGEFLSPYGIRSLSAAHRDPVRVRLVGEELSIAYQPAESDSFMFGGNSNWRGPVWFPVNFLLVQSLRRMHEEFGDDFEVELPTGSGRPAHLGAVADDLSRRLVSIFLDDEAGRRPVFGDNELFQGDAAWHDNIPFHEYFHGDNGAGLGASHQTGWTALVADLIMARDRPAG